MDERSKSEDIVETNEKCEQYGKGTIIVRESKFEAEILSNKTNDF